MDSKEEIMIETKNLTKKFDSKIVFENVNLQLKSGKSYAIVGQSGAGKTTLLNILGGLEKATSGEILIDGTLENETNIKKLRLTTFGFVFQNYGLMDKESIAENLRVGLLNSKLTKSEQLEKMKSVMKRVNLDGLSLTQKIYTLSGGEQQRVALARLILKKPTVIFADEPTGSLDGDNEENIIDHLLNDFSDQATTIIATHSPRVWQKCDYILKLSHQTIEVEKVA